MVDDIEHLSCCAMHNASAHEAGQCDCGAPKVHKNALHHWIALTIFGTRTVRELIRSTRNSFSILVFSGGASPFDSGSGPRIIGRAEVSIPPSSANVKR